MARTAVLAVFGALLWLVAACGGDGSDSGKPGPDEVAGKVIQVAGAVSAERNGQTRTLTVGAAVHGGDTIKTAADGTVTIEIDHNKARWTLDSNKSRRLDQSVVWNAPKASAQELLARRQNDTTTAAGRHAERSAAGTLATASAPPPAKAPAAPSATPPAAKASEAKKKVIKLGAQPIMGKRSRARKRKKKSSSAKKAAMERSVPRPPPPPPPAPASARRFSKKKGSGAPGGLALRGGGSKGGNVGGGGGAGQGVGRGGGSIGSRSKKSSRKVRIRAVKTSVTAGKLPVNVAGRIMRARTYNYRPCYDQALKASPTVKGKLVITLRLAATGKVTSVTVSGTSTLARAIGSCVKSRSKRFVFPKPADGGAATVVSIITFTVD